MAPSCRLDTLKKKASQLSTLCGVDVCLICFTPDDGVLTWPEKKPEVRTIISRYTHQSKKRPLCSDATAPPPAKRTRSSSPVPRNAQSDDLLGLLSAKLEKIKVLERKNGDSWMDLDPSGVRVRDSEIWRELELGELGCGGEEGECSLSQEEIESWVSALAAEGEMDATQSNLPSTALTLNEQIGDFEKHNGASENPLCVQVEKAYLVLNEEIRDLVDASENRLCEEEEEEKWMNSHRELEGIELGELGYVGEEGEYSLSLDEIELWVSPLAAEGEMDQIMATQSHLPSSDLETNNDASESPLCVEVEQGLIFHEKNKADSESLQVEQDHLVLNEEIRDLVDASESGEEKWMETMISDSDFQLWQFGEAETHIHMEKKRLSWDWNLLPNPIDC